MLEELFLDVLVFRWVLPLGTGCEAVCVVARLLSSWLKIGGKSEIVKVQDFETSHDRPRVANAQ